MTDRKYPPKAHSRTIVWSAFTLSFFFNLLRLTGPLFMLLIYDRVLQSRSEETLITLFAILIALLIAMGLFDYARRRLLARLGGQYQEQVETILCTNRPRGQILNIRKRKPVAGLDEVDALRGYLNSSGPISVLDFMWTPMFIAVIFVLHPALGWVAIGGLAVLVAVSVVRALTGREIDRQAQASSNNIKGLKDVVVQSRETLVGQSMTSAFTERWTAARRTARDDAIVLNDWTGAFPVIVRQLRMMLQYTVLATGAYLTLQGALSVGAMVAATFLVMRVFQPVEGFIVNLPATRRALANWRELKAILRGHTTLGDTSDLDTLPAQLSLRGLLVKAPGDGQPLLRSISADFAPGGMIEITGPSGAGKSVLAETFAGLWRKSSGSILLGGANLDRFSMPQFERRFGYCPEQPEFVTGTIEENIARMAVSPAISDVICAAQKVELHERIVALPEGYKTMIDPRARMFARGERARLALARAMYKSPDIMVIDDPDDVVQTLLRGPLSDWVTDHKARGGILIVLARQPLDLPGCNGRLAISSGKLQAVRQNGNVTSLSDKKKTLSSAAGPS